MLRRIAQILALSIVFPAFVALSGCTGSSVRTSAHGVEIAALALATAGDAISLASEADARSTCPDASAECIDDVLDRWRDVDGAFDLARATVGAWYTATVIASRASDGGDMLGAALDLAPRFFAAYAEIVAIAARHGVALPALPASVLP